MFFQFFLVESNGLCPRNERLLKAFTGASGKFWLPLRMLGGIIHINRTKSLSCNYDPRVDDEVFLLFFFNIDLQNNVFCKTKLSVLVFANSICFSRFRIPDDTHKKNWDRVRAFKLVVC